MAQHPRLKGCRVVVTGGAGFIGSHIVDRLLEEEVADVRVLSNFYLGSVDNLEIARRDSRFALVRCDVADYEELEASLKDIGADLVINCAVIPLPTSLIRPEWTIRKNIEMTLNLCKLLRHDVYGSLLQFSSSEACGSASAVPMSEDHPLDPETPYAASKAATDHIALSYHHTFGCAVQVVRPYNHYGPRQNARQYAAIVPLVLGRMLRGERVEVHGDGKQTRDFLHVRDTVDGVIAAHCAPSTRGMIVNVGSGHEVTVNDLVQLLAKLTDYPVDRIQYTPARPGDVRRHCADISLVTGLTGWKPTIDLRSGLVETVDWYRSHPEVYG